MRTDSQEFKDLMKKWGNESFIEELQTDSETYQENEDYKGN